MIITVSGGSGSGKSAIGEKIALRLQPKNKYYIATMEPFGAEAERRITRHRAMRAEKNFITVECPVALISAEIPLASTVLLECMSNLTANEIFSETGCGLANAEKNIFAAIKTLAAKTENLVIITNEIFADGLSYDQTTLDYIKTLGRLNQMLAAISDVYIEAVYSIPVFHKGALPWQL
ncbi:MAG: bifunctional adenosylcobinamide kinase/adenosylcobinamide-phosphate guanylyltransferase [Bacillota bacterium]|jgi:adenosylcobinamide kinase/adenosylcobinamide-phosphate guanylyltransferase